jgi:phosphatidate phosphatase APP1
VLRWCVTVLVPVALSAGAFSGHTAYHSASDAVARPESAALMEAWFSRGAAVRKAVEHTPVVLEQEVAGGWSEVAKGRTDAEGHVAAAVKAPATAGPHAYRWRMGEETVPATLWVVKEGQAAVVFDIDGTLTPSDMENVKDYGRRLVRNGDPRKVHLRVGAVARAQREAKEALVVYLTGRPPFLGRTTREWMAFHHLPEGPVFWMPETRDIWPSLARVGQAKLDRLMALKACGLHWIRGYGNASTDIAAYGALGIPKAQTFILGKHGGEGGTVALGEAFPNDADHGEMPQR